MVSIHEHAKDAIEVLNFYGFKEADLLIGHSQGFAVSLEAALISPKAIKSMFLMNGSPGHILKTFT